MEEQHAIRLLKQGDLQGLDFLVQQDRHLMYLDRSVGINTMYN